MHCVVTQKKSEVSNFPVGVEVIHIRNSQRKDRNEVGFNIYMHMKCDDGGRVSVFCFCCTGPCAVLNLFLHMLF